MNLCITVYDTIDTVSFVSTYFCLDLGAKFWSFLQTVATEITDWFLKVFHKLLFIPVIENVALPLFQ